MNKTVDINPIIDGTTYGSGKSGFTFDVYVGGSLTNNDVTDYYTTSFPYNKQIKIVANAVSGYTIVNGGTTETVTANKSYSLPVWAQNVTASRVTTVQNGSTGFYVYVYANTPTNASISKVQFPT